MESIGDTLRNARLRRGIDLEQVVAATKIRLHHLEAMEADQFERLPGGLFARSFLRQYACLLDLDERELLTSLDQQFRVPDPAPEQSLKPGFRPTRHASAFVWTMLALASLAAFHLWDRYHNRSLEAGTRIGMSRSTGGASREAVAPARRSRARHTAARHTPAAKPRAWPHARGAYRNGACMGLGKVGRRLHLHGYARRTAE